MLVFVSAAAPAAADRAEGGGATYSHILIYSRTCRSTLIGARSAKTSIETRTEAVEIRGGPDMIRKSLALIRLCSALWQFYSEWRGAAQTFIHSFGRCLVPLFRNDVVRTVYVNIFCLSYNIPCGNVLIG